VSLWNQCSRAGRDRQEAVAYWPIGESYPGPALLGMAGSVAAMAFSYVKS